MSERANDWMKEFPRGFQFGAATSSYQIEGAATEGGRGVSIWDTFSHTPGTIADGTNGDVACDHYHRFHEDIQLMHALHIGSYRFSVAWPRIIPQGAGQINAQGLAFYDALVDDLLAHHIKPCVTLYHWDLPQPLQDRGGWMNPDTMKYFQEYVAIVSRSLGDRVTHWITHNEPWCTAALGYFTGINAPGIRNAEAAIQVGHHVLYSHGLAVQTIRQQVPGAQVGLSLNLKGVYPASDAEDTQSAADYADIAFNRWFLDPLFKGQYPEKLARVFQVTPDVIPAWGFDVIGEPLDFLGVNYYASDRVKMADSPAVLPFESVPAARVTGMGWPVVPQGLHDMLIRLRDEYTPLPIYITENGAAYPDQLEHGQVHDADRVSYLSDHLHAVLAAMRRGVDVRGYYVWSLLDNFEWEWGYSRRFGIVYVDYSTQQRTVKDSGLWYRDQIAAFQTSQRDG